MASVQEWFGTRFEKLHPALQALHVHGGSLAGDIDIAYGNGIAGHIGRNLARKLGVPRVAGRHRFTVSIRHDDEGLHWGRCFDGNSTMRSLFKPVGIWPHGYWIEETGPIRFQMTVDVVDGGWFWRCQKVWVNGLRFPAFLLPESRAYKKFEQGCYRFYVGFSLPGLGLLLSYSGDLAMQADQNIVAL